MLCLPTPWIIEASAWNWEVSCRSRATTAKKCTKSVMHVQSCCFANINLLLFNCSRCRRRRRCLNSLLLRSRNFATMVTWRHTSPLYWCTEIEYSNETWDIYQLHLTTLLEGERPRRNVPGISLSWPRGEVEARPQCIMPQASRPNTQLHKLPSQLRGSFFLWFHFRSSHMIYFIYIYRFNVLTAIHLFLLRFQLHLVLQ